jgi:hypothetical protein
VPRSSAARSLLSLFQQALRHSIAADEAFASWMNYLYVYYYSYPYGCPGGVPTDANYDRAVSESGLATQVKDELAAVVNRMARPFGMRADWQGIQI